MNRSIINPAKFPKMPYSHAVRIGEFIHVSGQVGMDYSTGIMHNEFELQARQAFENLSHVLKSADSSLDKVIKTTVWLKDPADFESLNKLFSEYFPENAPTRSTPVVDLPIDKILISIEAIAI